MEPDMPLRASAELADAAFQAMITAGLALFALALYRRMRQRWFAWWAAAWALYLVRLGAIITFLATGNLIWLFWHQVATGWVALAILWAALVFSRNTTWRPWYVVFAVFPLVWGWVAVNGLDRFLLVALPMVLFLSGATLWTGWVFWRHGARTRSHGARFVGVAFMLWGVHHLDYPFLRARGAWQPWGYYLDIIFELAVGVGFALMVLSDLARGLSHRTEELARLSVLTLRQQEGERRRLSRELHDETAQTLSAVKLEVGMLREGASPDARDRLDHVLGLVDGGIRAIRRLMNDLRPALLDDLGLTAAIRALAADVQARGTLTVAVTAPDAVPRLASEVELALFRAVQEALANVVRHAAATRVEIALTADRTALHLAVSDNGRGFEAVTPVPGAVEHLGLAGMRERIGALGGTVRIDGSSGTVVRVDVPL
jgi:signal transduction histidine kinase